MSRQNRALITLAAMTAGISVSLGILRAAETVQKPNIVLILADDK